MQRRLIFLGALVSVACARSSGTSEGSGPVVVSFGDHTLTADQVQRELSEQSPFIRSRYQSLDKKKELVDGIIRLELLADEAKKEGFENDPDVQRELKKILVQRWMRKKFNDKDGMAALTDADLRAFYDSHLDDYQRPEKVRLQVIFYKIDGADAAKVKAEAAADQKALGAKVQKGDLGAFGDRARGRSDDSASKARGGDTDFHTPPELAKLYGDAFAAAAAALKTQTEVSPVVEGTGGVYLLRLLSRQPAFNRAFDQVKDTLRSRVWNERRNQNFDAYVKKLRDAANVKFDDAELAKLDSSKPDLTGVPVSHAAPVALPPNPMAASPSPAAPPSAP